MRPAGSLHFSRFSPGRSLVLAILVAVLAVAWMARATICRGLGAILVVDQRIESPQYVWIAAGDADGRFEAAAECYRRWGSRILLVESAPDRLVELGGKANPEELARRELSARGVAADAIEILPRSCPDRRASARDFCRWMTQHPQAQVQVLCRRLHSAHLRYQLDLLLSSRHAPRAVRPGKGDRHHWCAAPAGPCRQMVPVPFSESDLAARVHVCGLADPRYDETNWWQIRFGAKEFFYGWVGLAFTWMDGPPRGEEPPLSADEYERHVLRSWEASRP